jgi:hypothetical protein
MTFLNFIKTPIKGLKTDPEFRFLFGFILSVLFFSTIFYAFVEGWTIVDALFFSVMTMSTVGYGDLVPTTNWSKIFTIFFTFISIGSFVAFTAKYIDLTIAARKEREAERAQKGGKRNKFI